MRSIPATAALAVAVLGTAAAAAASGSDSVAADQLALSPVPFAGRLCTAATTVAGQPTGAIPLAEPCFCSITIYCEDDTTRSCQDTTSPCSCTGVDQNCAAGQQGYAQCNGTTYSCPACCSAGATRWVRVGCCLCSSVSPRQNWLKQICVGTQWVDTNEYSCHGTCAESCEALP
jgi:hypothetical protein